ncbi:MAG: hypothetical protein M0D55_14260 [Elusimicrobiota bacterium]|nr:MAG: hypothetical protein M0D55_14260 [Elusimicrobiota bacterium]
MKRIDPYWFKHPVLPIAVFLGAAMALGAGFAGKGPVAIAGAIVAAGAILISTRPAITGTVMLLGFLGGLVTFVISPNSQNAALSAGQKAMSVGFYTLFYAVLTEGALLLLAVVYNFFAAISSLGGLSLELEDEGGEPE